MQVPTASFRTVRGYTIVAAMLDEVAYWPTDESANPDAEVLVWQADTASMNPSVGGAVIAAAYEDDPIRAAAEYGAQFRRDVEGFVTREAVAACVVADRRELPPVADVTYTAFVDPSGGAGTA